MKLITTAAGLLLTVGAAALLLTLKAPAPAFGQAIEQVRAARTLSYTQLTIVKGQAPLQSKVFIAADGRKRLASDGVATIHDAAGRPRLTLLETTKTALVHAAGADQVNPAKEDFLGWLEALKKLGDRPDKHLGQKDLAGERVTGFVATQDRFTFTVWIGNVSGKPMRIEFDAPVKGAGYESVALTDFRFDANLDEALFSIAVPAGYTERQQPAVPAVTGGEASIVEALRGYTRRADGKFPASLTDWGPWAVLLSKDNRDGAPSPEATRVLANLGAITPFLVSLPKEDYAYLGEGKTTAHKDVIIFWHKRPNGTYRAIYGDLSARDIGVRDLPNR